jgi:hypothetical protein
MNTSRGSSFRVTADVYSHTIRGRDDEAAKRWEEFQSLVTRSGTRFSRFQGFRCSRIPEYLEGRSIAEFAIHHSFASCPRARS